MPVLTVDEAGEPAEGWVSSDTVYPEAYARVTLVRTLWPETHVFVSYYADAQARLDGADPVFEQNYPFDAASITNGNPYEAAYTALKTLPEFAGAVDV
jgi:hypothetical protein